MPWAARYNTWLLIGPKGVVFSFLYGFSNVCDVVACRYTHLQEQVTKQTYQVAALQKALQRTQDEVLTDTHSPFAVSLCVLMNASVCMIWVVFSCCLPACLSVYLPVS